MKERFLLHLLVFFAPALICFSQYSSQRYKLSSALNEISGLEKLNDSILVAINDGGNKSCLYFLNFKGEILHTCFLSNTQNQDWEDLAMDIYNNLYVVDCGNNRHTRKKFSVYQLNALEALGADTVLAEKTNYSFVTDKNDSLVFDCESAFWRNDSLYFIPKDYFTEKDTLTMFSLPKEGTNIISNVTAKFPLPRQKRITRRPTAADSFGDTLAILSYSRVTIIHSPFLKNPSIEHIRFKFIKQREALVFVTANELFIATEKHWLFGGPYLYKLQKK